MGSGGILMASGGEGRDALRAFGGTRSSRTKRRVHLQTPPATACRQEDGDRHHDGVHRHPQGPLHLPHQVMTTSTSVAIPCVGALQWHTQAAVRHAPHREPQRMAFSPSRPPPPPFRLQVTHLAGVGEDSMFMGVIQVRGGPG